MPFHRLITLGTGSLLTPGRCLHQVLRDASAFQITVCEVVLGLNTPMLGRSLPPNGGLTMVLFGGTQTTETELRYQVSVFGLLQ